MNKLPDLAILEFLNWLNERVGDVQSDAVSTPAKLSFDRLADYASTYLVEYPAGFHGGFPIRTLIEEFLNSDEFLKLESTCINASSAWEVFDQFMSSLNRYTRNWRDSFDFDYSALSQAVSSNELARQAYDFLNAPKPTKQDKALPLYMIPATNDVSAEINFAEWVLQNLGRTPSFDRMPSAAFDELVDEYIQATGNGENERKKLRDAYYQTGWTSVFRRIKRRIKQEGGYDQDFSHMINRYLSHGAKYKCIILMLADSDSQAEYQRIIKDEWQNLNDLSGDALDIFYSESHIGTSGYAIAKRIKSLPNRITSSAPSLVIWKNKLSEAKAVSIEGLNAKQIRTIVQTIVRQINENQDLDSIIREANKTVKEEQALNHGVTHNEINIGTNAKGNAVVQANVLVGQGKVTNNGSITQNTEGFAEEILKAIQAIKGSKELDKAQKDVLVSIMEDAKAANNEGSKEKKAAVKKAFGYIKGFLVKDAPALIGALANLTKVASFLGINMS